MRRIVSSAVIAGALTALLSSCGTSTSTTASSNSWAPKPQLTQGLTTLASVTKIDGEARLALHTRHGDVTFWGGVNVGTTVPGHNPGELATPRETFRDWFPQMADMGVRFIRTYTIMTPGFYEEFAKYNQDHGDAPLYLVQGIYLPDESYSETGTLMESVADHAFTSEISDASDAVHGDLYRTFQRGRASGTWIADVSKWLAGWIIGAELDPFGVERSNAVEVPGFVGPYFTAMSDSSPTERWLARHMDELAAAEASHHTSSPIAFVNWPTTDPLTHTTEPNAREDMVGLDANHVLPTSAWPGGSFASYHAYPYYPDFMRSQPELRTPLANGKVDPYLAYVASLKAHHARAGLPTMISEFGVPASIGAAHYGTLGRNQGAHTEQQAMAMDAQMLRGIKAQGLAGAMLFIWNDEWFKFTWNTQPRTTVAHPERRSLWHDPLTNEQWFGVVASDPVASGWSTPYESRSGPVRAYSTQIDASYVYVELKLHQDLKKPLSLGFNLVSGGLSMPGAGPRSGSNDVAIMIDPLKGKADAYVRTALDPIQLDGMDPASMPGESFPGWSLQRMSADRAWPATGGAPARAAEFFETGRLVRGSWDTSAAEYNSLSTWWLDRDLLELRIPWSMLLLGDPSSHTAVVPQGTHAKPTKVDEIGMTLQLGSSIIELPSVRWDDWNRAEYTLRIKAGADKMASAWRAVSKP